ncbi:MAG: hypothetical protein M3460_28310 [Actinomycetota bacterium]|nr:hypothetical protein [Actinomycetota bacterium]
MGSLCALPDVVGMVDEVVRVDPSDTDRSPRGRRLVASPTPSGAVLAHIDGAVLVSWPLHRGDRAGRQAFGTYLTSPAGTVYRMARLLVYSALWLGN